MSDTNTTLVGETAILPLRITLQHPGQPTQIRCTLTLSNPTVFYPQALRFVWSDSAASTAVLSRENDSTWQISMSIVAPDSSVSVNLLGEALAGNDSLCVVGLRDLRINDSLHQSRSTLLISRSIGTPLPYIRFASLYPAQPNPCDGCASIRWYYRIDKASALEFLFYDARGRLVRTEVRNEPAGVHFIDLLPDQNFVPGFYSLRMKSNSGNADQSFIVVK